MVPGFGMDVIALHDGRVMEVHAAAACDGEPCCIHNPSSHALDTAPLNWRSDRRIMERVCPHRIGHLDPDDVMARRDWGECVPECDGCCQNPGADGGESQ